MLTRFVAFVLVGALGLAIVAAFVQVAQWAPAPQQKRDHVVRPAATPEASAPVATEHVVRPAATPEANAPVATQNVVHLSRPGDPNQAAVAERFRVQPTPSIRATYFQSILTSPDFRLEKWFLTIEDVKSVDGHTRVTVRAIPLVTSRFAAITLLNGSLDETYEIEGDNLKLVKTDPPVDPKVVVQFGFDGF